MKIHLKRVKTVWLLLILIVNSVQGNVLFNGTFDKPEQLLTHGRGNCRIEDGVFKSKDSYACFGTEDMKDYRFSFRARVPKDAEQVQIWAGFRAFNRYDRYVVGIKGGLQDDLYLSRMGYMGTDELMDIRALDFHPVPGKWYDVAVEVCGNRIRVFLNNEKLPRIDVVDKNANLAPSGYVTLGGGWIDTEFDDLKIEKLAEDALKGIPSDTYEPVVTAQEKETQRRQERAKYQPKKVNETKASRTEVSLDGDWLFMPTYQLDDKTKAISASADDQDWHVMSVPDFWNPIRIWLHGETMHSAAGHRAKGVSDTYFQKETARCEGYTFDYKKVKAAWYRQWVELPEDIKGKQVVLDFDAVSKVAEVYINGELATSHIGMFGDFQADGTKLFKPGKNLVVVKVIRDFIKDIEDGDKIVDVAVTVPVTNSMLKDIAHGFFCDNPAGIWRPVKLTITNPAKVEDVFIKPSLTGADFELTLNNHSSQKLKYDVTARIVNKQTGELLYAGTVLEKQLLGGNEEKLLTFSVNNLKPLLWSPQQPNLYDFSFSVVSGKKESDCKTITSGFRTFEVKDGLFYLNGNRYWLRGGNHTPFALAPNDWKLADTFYQLMKAGNIDVTRTHTCPYNEVWMDAADENGIGVSYEGTWPWLMIHSSMPDKKLIDMWAEEFLSVLKKYRNHPSLLFWTVNNEMKFYDNEPDLEVAKKKFTIISDVVKEMRKIDPTRPICFDSNYQAKGKEKKFGKDFMASVDDGDIDDVHSYINWYDHTVFKQFKGEFQRDFKMADRPLISQEMSTGYPNNETGHPTRFYTLVHQNPQVLVGYQAYAFGNPESFLEVQSFITGELAEALRRSNDQASGTIHFALLTWFRNVYDADKINPYPTYYAMKRALQPILVSAELWGRNFYAGKKIPTQVYIVNDLESGRDLGATVMYWDLETEAGTKLASGMEKVPGVQHYKRHILTPQIRIPDNLPASKVNAKLKFRLHENGVQISENEYKVLIASKEWTVPYTDGRKIVEVTRSEQLADALKSKANLIILSDADNKYNEKDIQSIRQYINKGGKMIVSNSSEFAMKLYPEYINGYIIPTEGDIVNMEIPESPVFDGIDLLELRYFNNNKREVPTVCHAAMKVNRHPNVTELANQTKIHGYINGEMEQRSEYVKTIKGFPLVEIKDGKGTVLISTMATDKAATDPIAAKLLSNMISYSAK